MTNAKAYTIITPDGNPDSMKIISEGNWNGEIVFCSRERYLTARSEARYKQQLERPGVYILIGISDESTHPKIYIGEGDPIIGRIAIHAKEKPFWDSMIYITSLNNSLDKVQIQNLESKLCQITLQAKTATLDNGNAPQLPSVNIASETNALNSLKHILDCINMLGYMFFDVANAKINGSSEPGKKVIPGLYFIVSVRKQTIRAIGTYTNGKITVQKGSHCSVDMSNDCPNYIRTLRQVLTQTGVVVNDSTYARLIFQQDYEFSSPSSASGFIAGRTSNGKLEWKSEDGNPLADYLQ